MISFVGAHSVRPKEVIKRYLNKKNERLWTQKKPIEIGKIKRILVTQLSPFGDVFLASAPLEAMKRHLPDVKIYFLCYSPYQISLSGHPFIDLILAVPRGKGWTYFVNRIKTIFAVRALKCDVVIDQQRGPQTQLLSFFSGARVRIGYEKCQFGFLYNYVVPKGPIRYAACQKFDLLAPLGILECPFRFYFHITAESEQYIDTWLCDVSLNDKEFVVFSPGSPIAYKKWGACNYAALGDMIYEKLGLPILLLWAKNEYTDCQSVYDQMTHKPIMAPATDLNQAAALLSRTKLLVCNDGGLNHISCATETKTIALFGLINPDNWSPASVFTHHHHLHKSESILNFNDSFGISVQEVFDKVVEVL